MHYLVTGGAGFIGSHLVDALLAEGHAVTVLDNLSSGKRENLNSKATFLEGDICRQADVEAAFKGVDGCFHLAAVASVTKSIENWADIHAINQSGAVRVFEQASRQKIPVVYASSAAVYGDCENLPLAETERTQPLSPYGLDKLACEWQAALGSRIKELNSIGLRFFNVYGPRQDPKSPYSGVISIFMEQCKRQRPMTIFGDGKQTRDFIYIADVVACLRASMRHMQKNKGGCEVLNICTGKSTTIKEMATILRDIAKSENDINFAEPRSGDIRHSRGDPARAVELLGVEAKTLLKDGLKNTWQSCC